MTSPLSLHEMFLVLLRVVGEQYELFRKVEGANPQSLLHYKLLNEALKDDLALYKTLLEEFVQLGSGETLFKLLYTVYASTAYDNLKQTLNNTSELLEKFNNMVAGTNAITEDIDIIANCTVRLKDAQDMIGRAFKAFHTLYLYHDINASISIPQTAQNTRGHPKAFDVITSAFYQRPFGISAAGEGTVSVDLFYKFNKRREAAEKHAKVMAGIGRAWVKTQLLEGEDVRSLGHLQTRLMELLWSCSIEQLKEQTDLYLAGDDSGKADIVAEVQALEETLKHSIGRAKTERFSIAFCGMVKAGKSLFINSLMGCTILPSDELPSTAWPCRLRHTKGQTVPKLTFDPAPFRQGLLKLQEHRYGYEMQNYKPPKDDPFDSIFAELDLDDDPSESSTSDGKDLAFIFQSWAGLHQNTRQNLLKFEDPRFELHTQAEGENAVSQLLSELNDIVRLCHRFRLGFRMEGVEWPLLTVEFDSFRDQETDGIFEFIDLPGLGEGFEDFDFEDLIRQVAKETHAIVPIVNFKEIPKEDWKRLPQIISSGLELRTDLVICTHLDQISKENLPEQFFNVAKVFFPTNTGSTDRIMACSSLMGLSAYILLRKSSHDMPDLASFWDRKKIEYHCAEKILGTGTTDRTYALYNLELWQKAVGKELTDSGLPNVWQRLRRDVVTSARQRLLMLEAHLLWKHMHKIVIEQTRVLLEMRRTMDEFEQARRDYLLARRDFVSLLIKWEEQEAQRDRVYASKLQRSIEVLNRLGAEAVTKALTSTIADLPNATPLASPSTAHFDLDHSSLTTVRPAAYLTATLTPFNASNDKVHEVSNPNGSESVAAAGQQGAFSPVTDFKPLIVNSKAAGEVFFLNSQRKLAHSLAEIRRQFVTTIRKLANHARQERVGNLKKAIKSLDEELQPSLQEEVLIDLDGINLQSLAFHRVTKRRRARNVVYGTRNVRHVGDLTFSHYNYNQIEREAVEELGFMLSAPIAGIAAIPFNIMVFMFKQGLSKKYRLNPDEIGKRYMEQIVRPFLNDLITEGRNTLHQTMKKSAEVAKDAVVSALEREDARYTKQRAENRNPPKVQHIAELVAIHSNCVAAEAALQTIKEHLNQFM